MMAGDPDELVARVRAHPAYAELLRRRGRLAWSLTAVILTAFLAFTLGIAFDKAAMAAPIADGVTSIGIPIGFGLILLAILLTAIYVRIANRDFDELVRRIRADVGA